MLGADGLPDFDAPLSRKHDHEVRLCALDIPVVGRDDLRPLPPAHVQGQPAAAPGTSPARSRSEYGGIGMRVLRRLVFWIVECCVLPLLRERDPLPCLEPQRPGDGAEVLTKAPDARDQCDELARVTEASSRSRRRDNGASVINKVPKSDREQWLKLADL